MPDNIYDTNLFRAVLDVWKVAILNIYILTLGPKVRIEYFNI